MRKNAIITVIFTLLAILLTSSCIPQIKPPEITTPIPTIPPGPATPGTPAPSPEVPPLLGYIQVSTPRTAGSTITVDASKLRGKLGNEITFTWEQTHLPDRYAGTEYITGHSVKIDGYQSDTISFQPEYPGNYRFQLTVSNGNAKEELDVNIPVTLIRVPFAIKGIAYDMWHYTEELTYMSEGFARRANESGANLVMINPTWYTVSKTANTMSPCPLAEFNPQICRGIIKDEDLLKMIRDAHSQNLQVMIKPILNIAGPNGPDWPDIQPANWDEWFRNWTDVCLHYARIAQQEGVEYLALGNELRTTVDQIDLWKNLIGDVRRVYSGKLTYGDCSFSYNEWGQFKLWDELDYIGVHLWSKATGEYGIPEKTDPTVEDMAMVIEKRLSQYLDPVVAKYKKPVIFLEFGTNNYDGSNIDHYNWTPEKVIDNKEQAEYYEAGLRVFASRPYTEGVIIWAYTWRPELTPNDIDMSPAQKPAEEALKFWFGAVK